MIERRHLSKRDQEMAESYGGADEEDTTEETNTHYSDKTSHKQRSLGNDPRPNGHRKHK